MLCTSIGSPKAQAIHVYHTTWLIAKLDPIKFIFKKPSLSERIARWQVLLSEFDILYVSQKAIKGSAITDFLVERTNKEYKPMSFEFLDEDLMAILQIEKSLSKMDERCTSMEHRMPWDAVWELY